MISKDAEKIARSWADRFTKKKAKYGFVREAKQELDDAHPSRIDRTLNTKSDDYWKLKTKLHQLESEVEETKDQLVEIEKDLLKLEAKRKVKE